MISTLQTVKTYLWGWNFGPVCSTTTGFLYIRSPENQKCTEWPKNELEHLTIKSTLYTLNAYRWDPNFVPFRSTISSFRDTTCISLPKSEMHRMTPNWTWTLNSQKYSMYTKYLPLRPKFWSVSLYDQLFLRHNMYKIGENRKSTEWLQTDLEHLTVKRTLYIYTKYLTVRLKFWSISLYD